MVTEQYTLSENQFKIVTDFMQEFLPPCKPSCHLSNELTYVHAVVSKMLKQRFRFSLDLEAFLELCLLNSYEISTRKASFDYVRKEYKPDKEGTYLNSNPLYKKHNAAFIYLNIEGIEVHKLMKTVFAKPLYTVNVTVDAKRLMEDRLMKFRGGY
ncbi:MAG: hypothetical protein IPJ79_16445 [Bacteroidetes bacterium]|nr:hypothetical protein [Bacteroidota bacterium]